MAMSRLRNIGLSLYFEFLNELSNHKEKEKLTTDNYQVYHFSQKPILTSKPVYIYKNNVEINVGFTVNYENGYITFDTVNSSDDFIEASYDYCFVALFDEYPDDIETNITIPSVCIQYNEGYRHPLEMGTKQKRKDSHEFEIAVYASGSGQRADLASLIMDILGKSMPLVDYNLGFPINADGTKNINFNKNNQIIGWLEFENISNETYRSVNFGDVSLYVMLINFTVEDYIL